MDEKEGEVDGKMCSTRGSETGSPIFFGEREILPLLKHQSLEKSALTRLTDP